MTLDIRSLFIATAVVVLVNAVISTLVWHYAKSLRAVIGWWSLSWVLAGAGILLISLRHAIPDFLSVLVANACVLGGQIAMQEGLARYLGRAGYMRAAVLTVWAGMLICFAYLTYIQPSVNSRVIVFSAATLLISFASLKTLASAGGKEAPHRLLAAVLLLQMTVIVFRGIVAADQERQTDFLSAGTLHALGVIGILTVYSAFSLCFFWMVAYRLGLNIQKEALTDSLTGLANRRAMDNAVAKLQTAAATGQSAVGFLLIDIDGFKAINDQFGHQAGDAYLIRFGQVLAQNLRAGDVVFRYAGDEFVILAQNCDEASALSTAERLRTKVSELEVVWSQHRLRSTASVGVALSAETVRNSDDLMRSADEALYQAKKAGGNRIAVGG